MAFRVYSSVNHWSATYSIQIHPAVPSTGLERATTEEALSLLLYDCENGDTELRDTIGTIYQALSLDCDQGVPLFARGPASFPPDVSRVLDRLQAEARAGRLVLVPEVLRGTAVPMSEVAVVEPSIRPTAIRELAAVEFVLCDELGEPVPNARFEVVLSDGSRRSGRLNSEGVVRFDRIPPGECQVSFPDLDAAAWELVSSEPL